MKKYVCDTCGYVYDPEIGDPDNGIQPGTAFEDLPNNWQYENIQAAKVAVDLVYERDLKGITSETIEKLSGIVHEKRLERNWITWSFENQRVAYKDLSEEEKAKDRAQIEIAIKILKQSLENE